MLAVTIGHVGHTFLEKSGAVEGGSDTAHCTDSGCGVCLVHLTRFVFLKKGHHFLNALFAYKAQAKVACKVEKSKHKVRIVKSISCQVLRCNIARQRSLRGGINAG